MDVVTIPLVAMAGLYFAYNQDKKSKACLTGDSSGYKELGNMRTGIFLTLMFRIRIIQKNILFKIRRMI